MSRPTASCTSITSISLRWTGICAVHRGCLIAALENAANFRKPTGPRALAEGGPADVYVRPGPRGQRKATQTHGVLMHSPWRLPGGQPRRAVRGWGLDIVCQNPDDYSSTLTAVLVPDGHDADLVRQLVLDRYNMSLGAGLGRLATRAFRIGHLGDLGDLSLAGTLCGVQMGLAQAGVPIAPDGVRAALDYLGSAA